MPPLIARNADERILRGAGAILLLAARQVQAPGRIQPLLRSSRAVFYAICVGPIEAVISEGGVVPSYGVFREPLPDGLLRFDVRRRIEIDFSDPLSLTERQSRLAGDALVFARVQGSGGNAESSQVWKGVNPASAVARVTICWNCRPFPKSELGLFIFSGI